MTRAGGIEVVEAHGARIPLIGLGTWDLRGRSCAQMVEQALRLGYRHIDTAEMYDNEREVGEGLRASGVSRKDIFVVTKIWPSHFAPRDLDRAARQSLERLKLAEVDLLLLHWPNPRIPLSDTIGALCQARKKGFTRHIGVSNFTAALLAQATHAASEPLACNQVEMHPFLDQSKVATACRANGIALVAYSPIARGRLKHAVLERIGKGHRKSSAQIALRWLIQQGIAAIPRTSKIDRLVENFTIFDFALSEAEMNEISALASREGRIVNYAYSGSPQWD